jgi:hypothetical protein
VNERTRNADSSFLKRRLDCSQSCLDPVSGQTDRQHILSHMVLFEIACCDRLTWTRGCLFGACMCCLLRALLLRLNPSQHTIGESSAGGAAVRLETHRLHG